MIKQFIADYGSTIIFAVLTAVVGLLGTILKSYLRKLSENSEKKEIVEACVKATEQMFKDLSGSEKLNQCFLTLQQLFEEKGIFFDEAEARVMIEAVVNSLPHTEKEKSDE